MIALLKFASHTSLYPLGSGMLKPIFTSPIDDLRVSVSHMVGTYLMLFEWPNEWMNGPVVSFLKRVINHA
jgi:hypothetical protein